MTDRMTSDEIVGFSRDKGFAAQILYAIITEPVNGLEPIRANAEAHLEHQLKLEAEGVMFASGPLMTEDGRFYDGAGMIVIRAGSLEEADAVAKRDPMHASGARTYRILPWLVNEGSFSFTVRISDFRATPTV